MADTVLACEALGKTYSDADREVTILNNCHFDLVEGERVAIVGRSGAGKTTLLNLLGGLDLPSTGRVLVAGRELSAMNDKARSQWRNRQLGFVFQFHHLLPEFSALEAIAMPARIGGVSKTEAENRAIELLAAVGLSHRHDHRPAQLSGGERQRVAIARALVNRPTCVLLDEPTGNLDPDSAERIMGLIRELQFEGTSFVIVTHDHNIAHQMDRCCQLVDGALQNLS